MSQSDSRTVIERALRRELANVQDDLYRYRLQLRSEPEAKTGNGVPFAEVIAGLEEDVAGLRTALEEMARPVVVIR